MKINLKCKWLEKLEKYEEESIMIEGLANLGYSIERKAKWQGLEGVEYGQV